MKWIVLAAAVICCLQRETTAYVLPFSTALDNDQVRQQLLELAQAGEVRDSDKDTRLMPHHTQIMDNTNMYVCCFYGQILDIYLWNVLTTKETYPHLQPVRENLGRISKDLKAQGCPLTMYANDHKLIRKFKEDFHQMETKAVNKAIGEITILFYHLTQRCHGHSNEGA